jgi:hypothetical protein
MGPYAGSTYLANNSPTMPWVFATHRLALAAAVWDADDDWEQKNLEA